METEEQKLIRITSEVLEATGFKMENLEKVNRAVFGISTSKGRVGGVGEDANPFAILAKYDEQGGYITKKGYKVKNRAFYDPKTKEPIKNPKVVFLIRINDALVEHEEGTDESLEVQLAKKQLKEAQEKLKDAKKTEEREEDKVVSAVKRKDKKEEEVKE